MQDIVEQISEVIRLAATNKMPLCICGGGSKDFYGGPLRGETLAVNTYRGIVDYDPSELVITARAGTPLEEIETILSDRGQMLAFEPPHFKRLLTTQSPLPPMADGNIAPIRSKNRTATLGGCIAAGLSGPRRAYAGAVRDFVLGIRMLDGNGHDLRFGGQVMKNVAGFDLSRLMTGSLGTLGVILEASLKVLPLPVTETTLHFEKTAAGAIASINEWAGQPLPISATASTDGTLVVRLSGAAAAVEAAVKKLGGQRLAPEASTGFWQGIREHTDPFFETPLPLWRLSLKPTTPPLNLPGAQLIEWSGALRWLASDADAQTVRRAARVGGGHATLFRGDDKSGGVFQPLSPALMAIHHNLKHTFDPAGIFNPGRLYEGQ